MNQDNATKAMEMLKNMTASTMYYTLTIIVITIVSIYIMYYLSLKKRECSFLDDIYGTPNSNIHNLNANDPDCKFALRDYYIKTAYNCCSGGSYKNGFVSTCALKDVLKQGVRGLDFEI